MLGELSGSLAHELNQPLAAILSNAQAGLRFLAQDAAALDEVRNILEDIVADDKRASEVILRLRLLLRKDEVQHQPLDVNEVVQEVLKLVRIDLASHNIAVNIDLSSGLPAVIGDRVLLQQVLLNLISRSPRIREIVHEQLDAYRFYSRRRSFRVESPCASSAFRRAECGHIRFGARIPRLPRSEIYPKQKIYLRRYCAHWQ